VRYLRHLIMAPHTIRWGIISTGGIATKFSQVSTPHSLRFYSSNRVNHVIYPPSECSSHAQDILVDPSTRDVSDVAHKIAAVGSRSVASAQAFIDKLKAGKAPFDWGAKNGLLDNTKAYGSYEEVYNDPVSLASRVCRDERQRTALRSDRTSMLYTLVPRIHSTMPMPRVPFWGAKTSFARSRSPSTWTSLTSLSPSQRRRRSSSWSESGYSTDRFP
jgi:hypothetical protein